MSLANPTNLQKIKEEMITERENQKLKPRFGLFSYLPHLPVEEIATIRKCNSEKKLPFIPPGTWRDQPFSKIPSNTDEFIDIEKLKRIEELKKTTLLRDKPIFKHSKPRNCFDPITYTYDEFTCGNNGIKYFPEIWNDKLLSQRKLPNLSPQIKQLESTKKNSKNISPIKCFSIPTYESSPYFDAKQKLHEDFLKAKSQELGRPFLARPSKKISTFSPSCQLYNNSDPFKEKTPNLVGFRQSHKFEKPWKPNNPLKIGGEQFTIGKYLTNNSAIEKEEIMTARDEKNIWKPNRLQTLTIPSPEIISSKAFHKLHQFQLKVLIIKQSRLVFYKFGSKKLNYLYQPHHFFLYI